MSDLQLCSEIINNLVVIPGIENVDVAVRLGDVEIKILEAWPRSTDALTIARVISESIPKGHGFRTVGDRAIPYKGEMVYWSWLIKEGPKIKVVCALCGVEVAGPAYPTHCKTCLNLMESLRQLGVHCPNGKTKVLHELGQTKMNIKVYCIDCKHHVHQSTAYHSHKCDADAYATWIHTPIEKKKTGPAGDCMVINKNNDCKEYRRKLIAELLGNMGDVT